MRPECVCPRCRIERAFARALHEGVDAVGVRVVVDALSEIAVERIREGRFRSACNLLVVSASLEYFAHRKLSPEPEVSDNAPRATCEVN